MEHLPELSAWSARNPLQAEEFVWLTNDMQRAEVSLILRASPHQADKMVYFVSRTQELLSLYATKTNEEFKKLDLRTLREFNSRNSGVPRISMIAALKAGNQQR